MVAEDGRRGLDRRLDLALHRHASADWTRVMRWATDLGSAMVTVPLFLLLLAWLLLASRRGWAAVVAGIWLGAQLLDALLKPFYHRDRPALFPAFAKAAGYSFPSGHTVTAVVTYGLIAAVIGLGHRGWRRWLPALAAVAVMALVGVSRVYLGVHYPSDVLGGILAGGAWLAVALLAFAWVDVRGTTSRPTAVSPPVAGGDAASETCRSPERDEVPPPRGGAVE